jgi:hypothetical protein
VTLFDVYECAIDNPTLEKKIAEAERRLTETDSVLLWEKEYLKHPRDLEPFRFRLDAAGGVHGVSCTKSRRT